MIGGFLNILKPPGMSSHDVIGAARRILGVKRIGHAGTLDPAAAGVLPVAVGQAARLLEYLALARKSYRAEILFGRATDTGDDTGTIVKENLTAELPEKEAVTAVLAHFVGEIEQMLPAYSAVKIDGKRAYDLTRKGKEIELPKRRTKIFSLTMQDYRKSSILIDVTCHKGTYIRSLAESIGEHLGIPSTMGFLLRTQVGDFSLSDAITIEELAKKREAALLSPEKFLGHLPRYALEPKREKAFLNGLPTNDRKYSGTGLHVVYADEHFLGIGIFSREEAAIRPVKVFREEERR